MIYTCSLGQVISTSTDAHLEFYIISEYFHHTKDSFSKGKLILNLMKKYLTCNKYNTNIFLMKQRSIKCHIQDHHSNLFTSHYLQNDLYIKSPLLSVIEFQVTSLHFLGINFVKFFTLCNSKMVLPISNDTWIE